MESNPKRSSAITVGLTFAAIVAAIIVTMLILDITAANGNQSPIAGDPPWYNAIAAAILDGEIPYIDVPIEHLPGALIPMILVEWTSRLTGSSFETLWPFAMGVVIISTVVVADRIPADFAAGRRYLVLSLPLLPLVLFRIEPWLMLWVVASIVFVFSRSWTAHVAATFMAALTKGWPIILLALPFRLQKRTLALMAGMATLAALIAIAILPGFREGRAFEGIHTETIVGNLVMVFRSAAGSDLQLIGVAGAAYTAVASVAVAVNAFVGLPFLVVAGIAVFRTESDTNLVRILGLAVVGIILASPLFSSQFLYWLVPFVLLLSGARQRLYGATALATLITVIVWSPLAPAWSVLVLIRNVMLVTLAVGWASDVLKSEPSPVDANPSKNVA